MPVAGEISGVRVVGSLTQDDDRTLARIGDDEAPGNPVESEPGSVAIYTVIRR
jgi:hypothetical protein